MRLRIVSVPVSDVDAAKAFYTEKVGFEEVVDVPFDDGRRWCELAPPGAQAELDAVAPRPGEGKANTAPHPATISLVTWFEKMPPGSLQGVVLHVDDVRAAYAELSERGVQFTGEVQEQSWGLSVSFRDPDGNGWALIEPPRTP